MNDRAIREVDPHAPIVFCTVLREKFGESHLDAPGAGTAPAAYRGCKNCSSPPMNGHVTTQIDGRSYFGEYTLNGDVVTVTLRGNTKEALVAHGALMAVTRRLLRELARAEPGTSD